MTVRWWIAVLAALTFSGAIACASPPPIGAPPALTPYGLLPTPTLPPPGRYSNCSPDDVKSCPRAGDIVNLYREFAMSRAITLSLNDGGQGWVLEKEKVDSILRLFDKDTTLQAYSLPWPVATESFDLTVIYPRGFGWPRPYYRSTADYVGFAVDKRTNTMGMSFARGGGLDDIAAQWPLPGGFLDALFSARRNVAPTAVPSKLEPRYPFGPAPVPGVSLHHPSGKLRWGGPDDRLTSQGEYHCGAPEQLVHDFGIPALFKMKDGPGLLFVSVVPRDSHWHWTGYYRGDWQIWQADDIYTIYLVHPRLDRAFEYHIEGCA